MVGVSGDAYSAASSSGRTGQRDGFARPRTSGHCSVFASALRPRFARPRRSSAPGIDAHPSWKPLTGAGACSSAVRAECGRCRPVTTLRRTGDGFRWSRGSRHDRLHETRLGRSASTSRLYYDEMKPILSRARGAAAHRPLPPPWELCRSCGGSGQVNGQTCSHCGGSGKAPR